MLETDKAFGGSVPENYDRYMVPLIFEPYAADLARRVASLSPGVVLETAAGSGAVTRALAPQLADDARYVVTDLNRPMLDYAASRQPTDSRIEWRQADGTIRTLDTFGVDPAAQAIYQLDEGQDLAPADSSCSQTGILTCGLARQTTAITNGAARNFRRSASI